MTAAPGYKRTGILKLNGTLEIRAGKADREAWVRGWNEMFVPDPKETKSLTLKLLGRMAEYKNKTIIFPLMDALEKATEKLGIGTCRDEKREDQIPCKDFRISLPIPAVDIELLFTEATGKWSVMKQFMWLLKERMKNMMLKLFYDIFAYLGLAKEAAKRWVEWLVSMLQLGIERSKQAVAKRKQALKSALTSAA